MPPCLRRRCPASTLATGTRPVPERLNGEDKTHWISMMCTRLEQLRRIGLRLRGSFNRSRYTEVRNIVDPESLQQAEDLRQEHLRGLRGDREMIVCY